MRQPCVVVGGGSVGCAIAWRLQQKGLAVTLVERGPLARESSWAAAGILAPQAEAHEPGPLFTLLDQGRRRWEQFSDELYDTTGIDVGHRRTGTVMVALDETEADRLRARWQWQREAGLRAEWLESLPELAPSQLRLYLPDDHQVDPRLVGSALGAAAIRAGVCVRVGEARRILSDGTRVTGVLVDDEVLNAGQVVVAAGAWSSLLEGVPAAPRVRPLHGQILQLQAAPGLLQHVLFGDGGYLVPRADGRILVGSSEDDVGFVKQVTPAVLARLCQRAARLVPKLAQAQVGDCWSGLRPTTVDRRPILGQTSLAGLHLATGHHRNGILLTPLTAEIMAAVVTGERPPIDLTAFSAAR